MSENLRLARFYFVLLAIFTVGRWLMGAFGVPYDKGHHVFSLVTLTFLSSAYYGAFARRFRGYTLGRAVVLAMTLAVTAQLVIFFSTLFSYAAGIQSYFTHPRALIGPDADPAQVISMGQAMGTRAFGLVANTLANAIAGALGWSIGAVLPEK